MPRIYLLSFLEEIRARVPHGGTQLVDKPVAERVEFTSAPSNPGTQFASHDLLRPRHTHSTEGVLDRGGRAGVGRRLRLLLADCPWLLL